MARPLSRSRQDGYAQQRLSWRCLIAWVLLYRHGLLLLRGGVLRWRLETFGLYMPSLPNRRPWWRPNVRAVRLLLGQRGAYARWLREMRMLTDGGVSGWWQARLGPTAIGLHDYIQEQNKGDGAADIWMER